MSRAGGLIKSEDRLPQALDKCVYDGLIKTGSGAAVGAALSLIVFRRRLWPITLGIGVGLGIALNNCQNDMNAELKKVRIDRS